MSKKEKKERYIDRWRKQHKEVRLYFKAEEYEVLKDLASKHNMSVKEYILKYANDVKKAFNEGYRKALVEFIEKPCSFYWAVRKIYDGDIALYEVPCSICGKPMIFNHKDSNWESEEKPALMRTFKNWYHVSCKRSY